MLQAFFDGAASAVVGFALLDQNLRFIAINQTLAEINGYSVQDHTGKSLQEVVPKLEPIVAPLYRRVFTTLQPIINIEISGEVLSQPGATRHWLVSYVPVQTRQQSVYVGAIVVEITSQKQLINQLEQANQQLSRSNHDLEQFARTASHDLKEPLRTISSYAQLLERRYGSQLEERGQRYLNHILNSAHRSQALIKDLFTYAQLDSRGIEIVPVDLNHLLDEVLGILSEPIDNQGARIVYGSLPTVSADFSQLSQVFQNLLSNSLKFCPIDIAPYIEITAEQQSQHWLISVKDNGIGIDPKYQERIFSVFQRLHLKEEFEGTGIGLSICKKVVEQHRGQIWVESTLGKGANFCFTLPLATIDISSPV